MWRNLFKTIKDWWSNMFKRKDIKQVINSDIAISDDMISAIEEWDKMYCGKADWIDNDSVFSLRLEQSICKEFADICISEVDVNITNETLQKIFDAATKDLNEHFQTALALGSFIIKPLGDDKVEFVSADNFIPLRFDSNGRLMAVIFIETRRISASNYYRRFEIHDVSEKGLTIQNKAFHSSTSSTIGNEVSLDSVEDWARLPEQPILYPDMKSPSFGYYRNPIPNTIDKSKCGVSIYEAAKHLIRRADVQYGRLEWEFESSERAVHVSIDAIKKINIGGVTNTSIPRLNKRLFKALDVDDSAKTKPFHEVYSPEIREQNIISGLQEYKRAIELAVGLSYGDISDPQYIEKTATEIKAGKKRKYNTVHQINSNLKDCLTDLCFALAFMNRLTTTNYEFICQFKDSILSDEDSQFNKDMQLLANGIVSQVEIRMKEKGETEEQAVAAIKKITDGMLEDGMNDDE